MRYRLKFMFYIWWSILSVPYIEELLLINSFFFAYFSKLLVILMEVYFWIFVLFHCFIWLSVSNYTFLYSSLIIYWSLSKAFKMMHFIYFIYILSLLSGRRVNKTKIISRLQSEVAQSCPTSSDLMDCSLPDSSIHGIFQARVLEWDAIAFSNQ